MYAVNVVQQGTRSGRLAVSVDVESVCFQYAMVRGSVLVFYYICPVGQPRC